MDKINYVQKNKGHSIAFIIGSLSAFPFYYDAEPFYVVPIFVLLIYFAIEGNFDTRRIGAFLLLLVFVISGNIFGSLAGFSINYQSIFYTVFTFAIFTLKPSRNFAEYFLYGFSIFMLLRAITTIFYFLINTDVSPFFNSNWFNYLNTSTGRMWNAGVQLGWPNVYTAFLMVALFFFFSRQRYLPALLILAAGLLTGSRLAYAAIAFIFIFSFFQKRKFILLIVLSIVSIYFLGFIDFQISENLLYRLSKTSDRDLIFGNIISNILLHPFGIGNTVYTEIRISEVYESYHNSYLKIIVRYGAYALIPFILLVFPIKLDDINSYNILIVFFLLAMTFPQDIILHPHIALAYVMALNLKEPSA